MIVYKVKIGKGMLEFQGNRMEDVHKWGHVWGGLPDKCSCGSDDIHLAFMESKEGFRFCKLKCKDCTATYTIKQNKQGEYFIDPNEKFQVFQKNQNQPQSFNDASDVPF